MSITFHITGITRDRRNSRQMESARVIAQEAADQALELEWRRRVQANILRRLERRAQQFIGSAK